MSKDNIALTMITGNITIAAMIGVEHQLYQHKTQATLYTDLKRIIEAPIDKSSWKKMEDSTWEKQTYRDLIETDQAREDFVVAEMIANLFYGDEYSLVSV